MKRLLLLALVFMSFQGVNLAIAKETVITGKVLFFDTRKQGVWSLRTDANGDDVVYERDVHEFRSLRGARVIALQQRLGTPPINANCMPGSTEVDRASVARNGTFSITWKRNKDCGDEVRLMLKIELAFCNTIKDDTVDRCFEVREGTTEFVHWIVYPGSELAQMLTPDGWPGERDIGKIYFRKVDRLSKTDQRAMAANYFAALYDSAYVHHVNFGIIQDIDKYGPLVLRFPRERKKGAGCWTGGMAIGCKLPKEDEWASAKAVFHEHGHVLFNQAFGGQAPPCGTCPGGQYAAERPEFETTGRKPGKGTGATTGFTKKSEPDEDVDERKTSWGTGTFEYPTTAFQEGFANFVSRLTRDRCTNEGFDVKGTVHSVPGAFGGAGSHFAGNVTRALCDWVDTTEDGVSFLVGNGDRVSTPWPELYGALKLFYVSKPATHWAADGASFCDFVTFFVTTQNDGDGFKDRMASMTKLNGIDCGL